ncbi:hypothetical protein GC169_03120 [bacterium]|nr:hypothetical protein [bacterium]
MDGKRGGFGGGIAPAVRRAALVIGVMLVVTAGAATAQTANAPSADAPNRAMTAEEIRSELFGVDMSGFTSSFSPEGPVAWRECIEPEGATLYDFAGEVRRGRLTVSDEGGACFAYEDTAFESESCYRVSRVGTAGYVFWGGGVFHATKVVRGVRRCEGADVPIS